MLGFVPVFTFINKRLERMLHKNTTLYLRRYREMEDLWASLMYNI